MRRILVIADDLTGAGEIAAIAWRRKHAVRVLTGDTINGSETGEEVTVINTDTRNLEGREAAAKVGQCLRQFDPAGFDLVYKKTDSLLRGQVPAELLAVMHWGRFRKTILVPANPSRDRLIREGHYFVGGIPLHETEYRHDPEFPRLDASVKQLLAGDASSTDMQPADRDNFLDTVVIPDIKSREDIRNIVHARIGAESLPAGAADFFAELLEAGPPGGTGHHIQRFPYPEARVFIMGSCASTSKKDRHLLQQAGFRVIEPSGRADKSDLPLKNGFSRYSPSMHTDNLVISFPEDYIPGEEERRSIADELTGLAAHLAKDRNSPVHFLVTGGRTASDLCRKMGWNELCFVHSEAQGVASFKCPGSNHLVTFKPGSYRWPATFLKE